MKKIKIFTAPLMVLMGIYFSFLKADTLVDSTENYRIYQLDDGTYKAVVEPLDEENIPPYPTGSVYRYYYSNAYSYSRISTPYVGQYEEYNSWYSDETFRTFFEYDLSFFQYYPKIKVESVFVTMMGDPFHWDSTPLSIGFPGVRPSSMFSDSTLWKKIGLMNSYISGYVLLPYGGTDYPKLPGAESDIQAKLDSSVYWYSIGVRSDIENQEKWENLSYSGNLIIYYHIIGGYKVRVIYPNGGEAFISGETVNIQWCAEDTTDTYYAEWVKLWYVMDGVEYYIGQKNNTNQYNPWTGTYPWTVPNVSQVKDVKIKVLAHFSDPENTEKVDYSDDFFQIGPPDSVHLIWPSAQGIVIEEGRTYHVRYDGCSVFGIQNVKAWFSSDGGQTWEKDIGQYFYDPPRTEVFDDSIQWNVAEQPTLTGRVKVVLTDANNQTAEDISDYNFELKPARPSGLSATSSYPYTSVNLSWTNNSAYANGYEVHRKVMDGTWKFLKDVSTTSYTDNSVSRYYDYWYKVNTYTNTQNGKVYSYFSNERWVTTSPFLAIDNASVAKSGGRSLIKVGTRLHAVYSQAGKIYYRYSDDNGLTWSAPEYIGDGVTPVICADADNNLWVAWAKDSVWQEPHYIYYAKKTNGWQVYQISGVLGFNPVIVYGPSSSWQLEGIYIGFEDYIPSSAESEPPYTDIYLYRVNVNNPGSYTQVGYYRLSGEIGMTTDLTIGKVSYEGEDWVLLVYRDPGDSKLYCIEGAGGSPFALVIELDDVVYGKSPSFGNNNLLCFKAVSPFWNAPRITVAKFNNSQGGWMYYPNRNSQSQYADGNNPQIRYLSSGKTIVYEKNKQVYLQPISRTPDDPVLLTSMPSFSQNLYPHLTLRGGLFTYAEIIYPFADTVIYKEWKLPSSTPLANPNGGTQGYGDNMRISFSLKVNPAIISKTGIFEIGIPEDEKVELLIYDVSGSVVKRLMSGKLSRGIYRFNINPDDFSEGVYFGVLRGEKQKRTARFMIVK